MKKIIVFLIAVFSFILVSCKKDITHQEIFDKIKIEYNEGEDKDNVKNGFKLPSKIEDYEAIISYKSTNESVIAITGYQALVVRKDSDVTVKITVTITIKEVDKEFSLEVKVIKEVDEADKLAVVFLVEGKEYDKKSYEKGSNLVFPTDPELSGHKFIGWYIGTEKIESPYKVNEELEISAKFQKNPTGLTFDVIFIVDGAEYDKRIFVEDSNLVFPNEPEQEGYTFTGWYLGTEKITLPYKVTKNLELVAKFEYGLISGETIIETFDNLATGSSSYSSSSFQGVDGITWSYVSSRTDEKLNGNALTFGNRSEISSLSASLEGGISKISLKAAHAFSGDESRPIEIKINGNVVATFQVKSGPYQSFSQELSIKGSYTLEISSPNKQRITIDDISITGNSLSPEQIKLEEDKFKLSIPTMYISNGDISLPKKGLNGSNITWDGDAQAKAYIDFENDKVTVPAANSQQVKVTVTATLSFGDFETTKSFIIALGEGEPISIGEVLKLTEGSFVKTKGTVTGFYIKNDVKYTFIEDETGGILLIGNHDLAVDDLVIIKGKIAGGSITEATVEKIGEDTVAKEELLYVDDVSDYINQSVTVKGFISSFSSKRGELFLDDVLVIETIFDANLNNMDYIEVSGFIIKISNYEYRLLVLEENDLVKSTNNTQLTKVIQKILGYDDNTIAVSANMDLDKTDEIFSSTITWESSDSSIISNDGVYNAPEEPTQVTLTATIKNQGTLVGTFVVYLNVLDKGSSTDPDNPDIDKYYSKLNGLTGEAFENALRSMIKSTGSQQGSTAAVKQIDTYNGKYYLIYDGYGSYGNREHVFPATFLRKADRPEDDLHNLRAAVIKTNSDRSSFPFGEGTGKQWVLKNSKFYPGEEHLGDVARIVLYMMIRNDLNINDVGSLNMFLKWHKADPVNDFEVSRNNNIYAKQNNRNPFIDFPDYITTLFGEAKSAQTMQVENLLKAIEKFDETQINVDFVYFEERYYII
ncbi:MAG: endonuclease [Acholeplasma sp.]|nr:endonuclease [Acholeplasma sp.]